MTYNSKKSIISTVFAIILIVAYIIYALSEKSPAMDNLKAWARLMLIFIGIGIVCLIIIQMIFHIVLAVGIAVKEKGHEDKTVKRILSSSMFEDERDRLISLKSSHVGYICVGIGFIASLIALVLGMTSVVALHILFGAFAGGSIIEGILNVYFNEKGCRNG
jgi:ABC-type multidrug transport system permease subunit